MKSIYILLLIIPLTMACGENGSSHQDHELWHCDTNTVILKRQVCNGQRDCSNGSDETIERCLRKRCTDTEYRCAYGACIPAALKCNRHIDCADGSDETRFLCEKDAAKIFRQVQGECDSVTQIQCHTGECIREDQRCDGTVHCADGSDESVAMCAHLICPRYAFRCAYGACIAGIKYCDGIRDCADGSDEICQLSRRSIETTEEQSPAMPFRAPCRIPQRTPNLRITLRDEDAVWELHYKDLVAFGATIHFSCLYEFRLEGVTELTCKRGDWFKNWPKCVPPDDQPTCAESQWQCVSGDCIDRSALCNGAKDCRDGADETVEQCIANICADGDYRCAYGACVASTSVCNGAVDCADGSDETRFLCSHNKNELWNELQGTCNSTIIVQCACGDCITEDYLCDGLAQCPDSSDESVEMCAHIRCPLYAFRCGYGACISGAAICDGIADCHDWSDEATLLCAYNDRRAEVELDDGYECEWTENQDSELNADQWEQKWVAETDAPPAALVSSAPSIQCTLPLDRPNLLMENAATNTMLLGGSKVDPMTVVRYRCVDDWQLVGGGGELEAMCVAGDAWTSAPPRCEKYCDSTPITRGRSTSVKCYHNQQRVDCSSPLPTGTVAEVQCASGYRRIETADTRMWLRCDADGEWDYAKFRCTPTCTEPLSYEQPSDKAPYNAAIYKLVSEPFQHRFECSGAIITPKIVLTAAICLTAQGQLRDAGDPLLYKVVVGASDADVYDAERAYNVSQILLLRSVSVNDVESFDRPAAVVLADFIVMGPTVMPICLDFRKYACYNEPLQPELIPMNLEPGLPHKLGAVTKVKSHTQQSCLVLVGQLTWVILDYFIQPIELQLMRYNYLL